VDFNLEQAWPQDTDRQQFYYLERETRKLEEVAYSDAVMDVVASTNPDISAQELRGGKLYLSQPAEGGWNFYVDDVNPERAAKLATAWATQFAEQVHVQTASADGLNSFIEATVTQVAQHPAGRSVSMSLFIFVGAVIFLMIGSIVVLFVSRPQ
jgi:capsular polysaccharide biosynthesis protein